MKNYIFLFLSIFVVSCSNKDNNADAYGNFEAIETIISSQVQGEIKCLGVEKGMSLDSGQLIGWMDSTSYYLHLQQLVAQRKAIESKAGSILSEIEVQQEQKAIIEKELQRLQNLLKDGAATQKQMDDVTGQIRVIESRIKVIKSQNNTLFNEIEALNKQIEQAKEQLNKCKIINPVRGIVLEKYVEPYELAIQGKALYKIADVSELDLRVYVSGDQLGNIKTGKNAEVLIDKDKKENRKMYGTVIWISDNAEFTPKIIQTKKERVNMVYAVLIRVKNDGSLKIGMPGEVKFK